MQLNFFLKGRSKQKKMMFTALMECQRDIYNLTLQQYRSGSVLERCAISSGLQPEPIVTLNSDVLGRLVFSALGQREEAGGYSEEDRNRFFETTFNLLNKGGEAARNANVLFDPNLSNSQKASKFSSSIVNEFGGPGPFTFGAASFVVNLAQLAKQRVDAAAKVKAVEDQKKLRQLVDNKSKDFQNVKEADLIAKVAERYNAIKTQHEDLIKFFQSNDQDTSTEHLKAARKNVEKLQVLLGDLVAKEYTESEQSIRKALLIWLGTNFESMKNIIIPNPVAQQDLQLPANLLNDQAQKKITDMVKSIVSTCAPENPHKKKGQESEFEALKRELARADLPPERVNTLKSQLKQEVQKSSVQMLEAFRKESVALRFVLQELLKSPAR